VTQQLREDEEGTLAPIDVEGSLVKVLAQRGEARLETILDSQNPKAVVGAMSQPETFFTFALLEEDGKRTLLPYWRIFRISRTFFEIGFKKPMARA